MENTNSFRWGRAVLAIVTLICLGLIYAWSVFVTPMEAEFGWVRAQTSLTFTICMCLFCVGNMFTGCAVRKVSARVVMVVSACCIVVGFILASGISTLPGLYVCYGAFCGFGVGVAYNSILNSILKWFPDKTGILSGILLMGFGFGGSILGSTAVKLMDLFGWRFTFKLLGIVLAIVIVLASLILRPPTEEEMAALSVEEKVKETGQKNYTTTEMFRTSSFYFMFLWLIFLSAIGLTIVGNASPIAQTMTDNLSVATFVAGLVSIFNGVGRLCVGFLLDYFGSKKTMLLYSTTAIISTVILMLSVFTGSLPILVVGYVLVGFSFGAGSPTQSAYISKVYGPKYYSTNFSIMNLSLLVAAFLGPYVMGLVLGIGGYTMIMVSLLILAVLCMVMRLFVRLHFEGMEKKHK